MLPAAEESLRVPLVDLHGIVERVSDEVMAGVRQVMSETAFVGGLQVADFERAYARWTSARHCIGVANGTDALEIALRASGIRPGDEVMVPANSFAATAEAVARIGALPIFVDVTEDGLIDPSLIGPAVTHRTTAIVPVHLYGQMADMDAIAKVATQFGLAVVEDAAQAHGARQHGRAVGGHSLAAAYSFYPGKNLGAFGDAGALVTDDAALAGRARMLAQHGGLRRYEHEVIGFNSRLDTIQAVVLRIRLRHLDVENALRRHAAARYAEMLADVAVRTPRTVPGNEHVWHLYVIELLADRARDNVLTRLNDRGVGAAIHYPVPLHLTPAFRSDRCGPGDLPIAERRARRILSLPMFPYMKMSQQEKVVEELRGAVQAL